MLKAVIENAGLKNLFARVKSGSNKLATVPAAVHHVDLESHQERPVEANLCALLLLPKSDERFTSCVLMHGMGGTGKASDFL